MQKNYKLKSIRSIILNRSLITLVTILFIRIGTFIPIPGVNLIDLALFIEKDSVTTNIAYLFSGGDTFKIGLFTLNIVPYINASIITQIIVKTSSSLSELQKEGDLNSKRIINRLTRLIALIVALFQSLSLGLYLRSILFEWNIELLVEITISLTTGSMIILWLSELITEYGLGNGPSLLVFTNILLTFQNINTNLVKQNEESLTISSLFTLFIACCLSLFVLFITVNLQEGVRYILIISSKQLTNRYGLLDNYLPLRVNESGIIPIILTTSILVLPTYINKIGIPLGILSTINLPYIDKFLQTIYWIIYFGLIIVFSLFYAQIALNPKDLSDQLKNRAVALPGLRPGIQTTFFLRKVIQRLSFIGSFLLATAATLPNIIAILFGITDITGLSISSLIILIGILVDIEREIAAIIYSNIYRV